MTTRALEEVDRGLGSCLASEDLSVLAEPCPGTPRLAEASSWPQDSQQPEAAANVDARPKKMEKEAAARVGPGPGKEKLKPGASGSAAGTAPRSAPARKKAQATPPPQPPPPPPSQELPWGEVSLNKCLVLASLVALLGSALQLCRDAVVGEAVAPTPVPEPWVPPPSSPRKEPVSPPLKPEAWAPPSGPPTPQREAEGRPQAPRTLEAAEKAQGGSGEATGEATGEERAPVAEGGPKEKPRKERPRKEKRSREEKPRKERPQKEERPRASREPREALPRHWETREGGRRPWAPDSRDPEHRKRPAWVPPRRRPDADQEDGPPGRRKHRAGKGRD